VFEPKLMPIANEILKDTHFFLSTQLPLEIMHRVATLPGIGN
jgi:hypothetical protein